MYRQIKTTRKRLSGVISRLLFTQVDFYSINQSIKFIWHSNKQSITARIN